MTATTPVLAGQAAPDTQGAETFGERFLATNPFTDNRVNGPTAVEVDVDAIHHGPFSRLKGLAREAHQAKRGTGAILWGEAGVGKSHLLGRLARWAERNAHLVYLHNLQASPDGLPRSLLKAVINALARGQVRQFHETPLFRLADGAVRSALNHDLKSTHAWSKVTEAYQSQLDRLAAEGAARAVPVDRTVHDIFFRFYRSVYEAYKGPDDGRALLAVRWLSGDYLDPDEARRLRLPPGPPDMPVALADNQQIKQVLVALCQLAAYSGRPFILCFDQVDNLDTDQAGALSRFLEALLDGAPNLLVVTAGVQATLHRWRQERVIQDSAWDRLGQFEIALHKLAPRDACRIVAARLEKFLEPFLEVEAVRRPLQEDDLFPLGRPWAREFFRDKIEVRPREALNGAREGWRREQERLDVYGPVLWLQHWGRPMPQLPDSRLDTARLGDTPAPSPRHLPDEMLDRRVEQKLAEYADGLRRNPESLVPDAAHLTGLVQALLEPFARHEQRCGVMVVEALPMVRPGHRSPYDLLLTHRLEGGLAPVRTGLVFLTTASAAQATVSLRRLAQDVAPPDRVILVTDQREPLRLASKGREYYEHLCQLGAARFRHAELSFTEYVELSALSAAYGWARSGDLEYEPRPGQVQRVSEADVGDSHFRRGRYQSIPLLRTLLT